MLGPYCPVARKDVERWPIVGGLVARWGFVSVERRKEGSAQGGQTAALTQRATTCKQWNVHPPILIFPEGTRARPRPSRHPTPHAADAAHTPPCARPPPPRCGRHARPPPTCARTQNAGSGTCTNGEELLKFKSGAFVAGEPVVPVTTRYYCGARAHARAPPSSRPLAERFPPLLPHAGPELSAGWVHQPPCGSRWWKGVPSDLTQLLRIILARNKVIDAHVLPPYVPSAAERADPAAYASAVRRAMAEDMGVPVDERFGLEDARAFYATLGVASFA